MEKMITIPELADALNVSVKTIYEWNSLGTGPAYVKAGGGVRFRPSEVERWLNSRPIAPRSRAHHDRR
ncbi:helix-turn-helix domain-containing protein [Streptomyces sp. B-S-A8]|uniref:Helix-turn-helix domain-containing protein n=1 Tax=Streptomyces solicavernae TaxID=3043614 RepID=A0ABT6RPJ7_9ACTN|nr:helix-turn-helix domain-containing protein [Streptomyces sp. B-S-A8]MDI3386360.1 helix-turn-helix domain-containing protein [Streptomyces sp. B-S-A8]